MPTIPAPYYGGGQVENPANVIKLSSSPNSADIHHNLGTLGVNPNTNSVYALTSKSGGTANWELLGGNSAYPISPYVVGPAGSAGYQTIQSAVTAAGAAGGGVIYVQPGTYTENLTFPAGVVIQIVGAVGEEDSGNIILSGVHVPAATGNITIRGFQLNSATHIFSSAVAGSSRISFEECTFNVTDGWTLNLPNWTGSFHINDCGSIGTNDGVVNNSGAADIFFNNCQVGAGTTRTFTTNGAQIRLDLTYVVPPITISGSGLALGLLTVFGNTLTVSNTVNAQLFLGDFLDSGGNAALITTSTVPVLLNQVSIDCSNVNVIQGTGAVNLNAVGFAQNSGVSGTVTLSSTGTFKGSGSFSAGTSVTAGTTLTATLGNITATNGNLVLTAAGNKMVRSSVGTTTTAGANSIGSVTLVGGTATVSTTAVTTNSLIKLWRQSVGATGAAALGILSIGTITNGTSFVINSWSVSNATSLQASDVSSIGWEIIN